MLQNEFIGNDENERCERKVHIFRTTKNHLTITKRYKRALIKSKKETNYPVYNWFNVILIRTKKTDLEDFLRF